METFRLYAPEPRFEEAYKQLRLEALLDHEPAPAWLFPAGQTYLQWLAGLAASRRCRDWRCRFVPYRVYFLVDASGCITGAARLLMGLNEPLSRCGGQLSLWVIPSRRGQGIGALLLKKVLRRCAHLGLPRILVFWPAGHDAGRALAACSGRARPMTVTDRDGRPLHRAWIAVPARRRLCNSPFRPALGLSSGASRIWAQAAVRK